MLLERMTLRVVWQNVDTNVRALTMVMVMVMVMMIDW